MTKKIIVSLVLTAMAFTGLQVAAADLTESTGKLKLQLERKEQYADKKSEFTDKKSELVDLTKELERIYASRKAADTYKDEIERGKLIIEIREAYADKKSQITDLTKEIENIYGDKEIVIEETLCNIYNDCKATTDPVTPSPEFISFKSDTDLSRIHRVIALLENTLQEAILGGVNGVDDATAEGLIEKVANIYLVSFDDNGSYPGIVGEIYERMLDFQQVDNTGTPLPLEQDGIRQLLYMARAVLVQMPRVHGDTVVNGTLAVAGDTRLHNTGIHGALIVDGEVVAHNMQIDYIFAKDVNIQDSVTTASLKAEEASFNTSHIREADIDAAEIEKLRSEIINAGDIVAEEATLVHAVINSLEASVLSAKSINTYNLAVDGTIGAAKIEAKSIGATSIVASILDVQDELSANSAKIEGSLAVGLYSTVKDANSNSVALGYGNEVAGQNSFAIGTGLTNNVSDSIVMGFDKPVLSIVKPQPKDNDELIELRRKMDFYNRRITSYRTYAANPRYARRLTIINKSINTWTEMVNGFAEEYESLFNELNAGVTAKVGIGTNEPTRMMHISGAMKLEPMDAAPENPTMGDIYVNYTGALCIYLQDEWQVVAGDGDCESSIVKPITCKPDNRPGGIKTGVCRW